MTDYPSTDYQELFTLLAREIGEWEDSRYYLPDEELFDLERFLSEHQALELKGELEQEFGVPLNRNFWVSSLKYWRLRQARKEVKSQEAEQDRKRRDYLRAEAEGRKAWQEWLKDLRASEKRRRFKVIPGGGKTRR
jgi:hypothetical protein